MTRENRTAQKVIVVALLAVIALVSMFWAADTLSSPELHAKSIAALDEKKITVMELTAAAAGTSIAVSAIPGDATTPIANQIAELSSYLLVVVGALLLEKFLLTMTCYTTFRFLIPAACVLGIVWLFTRWEWLKTLVFRLVIFGAAICLIVPASLGVSGLIDETFQTQQMIEEAAQTADQVTEEMDDAEKAEESGIKKWFSDIGETITSGVSGMLEKAEQALNRFIDAIAVLIITTCVIPIAVLLFFVWVTKIIFGIEGDLSVSRLTQKLFRNSRTDTKEK